MTFYVNQIVISSSFYVKTRKYLTFSQVHQFREFSPCFTQSLHLNYSLNLPPALSTATKLVGPLTVKPPSPLPRDLEQFISEAGDKGIILFSLGTLGDAVLQVHQVDMLAEIFGRLEQRIIWRLNGEQINKVLLTHLGREIKSII